MALPKKKSRKIVVDGTNYRYAISVSRRENDRHALNLTIQNEERQGRKLIVQGLVARNFWLDFSDLANKGAQRGPSDYPTATPRQIRWLIQHALEEGWTDSTAGPDFVLTLDDQSLQKMQTATADADRER